MVMETILAIVVMLLLGLLVVRAANNRRQVSSYEAAIKALKKEVQSNREKAAGLEKQHQDFVFKTGYLLHHIGNDLEENRNHIGLQRTLEQQQKIGRLISGAGSYLQNRRYNFNLSTPKEVLKLVANKKESEIIWEVYSLLYLGQFTYNGEISEESLPF